MAQTYNRLDLKSREHIKRAQFIITALFLYVQYLRRFKKIYRRERGERGVFPNDLGVPREYAFQ